MVYRIYVEKKPGFDVEANGLKNELTGLLGIRSLTGLRLLNRYDVEGIDEALFHQCVSTVFSEPPVDNTYAQLPEHEGTAFAVEYLPGQFDQRADSAAECIQLISQGERPLVRSARVYLLEGALTDEQLAEIKKYVINPVEAREASLDKKATLKMEYPVPTAVAVLDGFNQLDEEGLKKFIDENGLAMDLGDIKFCQEYFRSEQRDPTITEIKMIDTYWSDHCRHTTFGTILDDVQIDDEVVQAAFDRYMAMRKDLGREGKPRCMMDLATIGAKELKKQGILKNLDESEEINACTVKIKCDVNGKDEDWLFLFKNETHNHPTEIEPFGGAATCIGGAIRDPLSGRSYVYQAMRITGSGDPRTPYSRSDIAAALEQDASFAALRQAVGEKLCRLMTEKDDDMLLGLYSDLGLGADVIFSLVGHCVERTERRYGPGRRPTMRQVEKEGYRWKRLGLVSAELVEEYLKDYARRQQIMPQMMEALRLGSRDPVNRESTFLERWIEWGFPPDVVEYAYEITIFKCGKLEWRYLDGILRDLHKKGLHSLEEISAKDKPPQTGRSEAAGRRRTGSGRAAAVEENDAWMDAYLKEMDGQ